MGNEEEAKEKKRILTKLTGFTGSGYRGIQSDEDYVSDYSGSNMQIQRQESDKKNNSKNKNSQPTEEEEEEEIEEEEEVEEEVENNEEEISEKPTVEETVIEDSDNKVPYTFYWSEGGTNVKVTGTFSNWKETYKMAKDPSDQVFKITIKLKKSKHEYKFIVDDKWKYSNKQPKINDGRGNTNNFIDLTNYRSSKRSSNHDKKEGVKKTKIIKKIKKIHKKINKKKEDQKIKNTINENNKMTGGYGCVFPKREELNEETKPTQDAYMDCFRMDEATNQGIIGRAKFLKYKKNDCYNGDKSYEDLLYSPHVNLNHTLTACNDEDNLLHIGLSHRFRDKDCTFIYYSHLNQ